MKQNINLKKLAGKIILVTVISGSVIYGVSPAQASNLTVGDIFSGVGFLLNVAESNRDVPPPPIHREHYRSEPHAVYKVPAKPAEPIKPLRPEKPIPPKKQPNDYRLEKPKPISPVKPAKPVPPKKQPNDNRFEKPKPPVKPVRPTEPTRPTRPNNDYRPEKTKPAEPTHRTKPNNDNRLEKPNSKPQPPVKKVNPKPPVKPNEIQNNAPSKRIKPIKNPIPPAAFQKPLKKPRG